ncbi:unnamed protein product [Schistocephalus solidus]|uniref:Ecdysone-induced protein 74EF n=1 Tax=Schistocephalus solidus TaxID=70667 RepID=A0A183TC94_SCHSO|nr:unnamed protein product [Schistocephalus solidus]
MLHGTARLASTDLPGTANNLDLKPAAYSRGDGGLMGGIVDGGGGDGGSSKSRFLPAVASKRRSLKRPAPSEEAVLANHHHPQQQQQQQPSTQPLHHHHHRLVSSTSPEPPVVCTGSLNTESLSMSRQISTAAATSLPETNLFLPLTQQQPNPPCLSASCRDSQLVADSNLQLNVVCLTVEIVHKLSGGHPDQPVGGIHHVQPLYPPQAIGPPPPASALSDCSSLVGGGGVASGKSTPRQPAKKRLEARTPTIDGVLDDLCIGTDMGLADMKTGTGNGSGGFQLHTDTPFSECKI